MKVINSRKISKNTYQQTINITEYDLEQFEDWFWTDLAWLEQAQPKTYHKLINWVKHTWHELWENTWRKFDDS